MIATPRIRPLESPFTPEVETSLAMMMGGSRDVPPLALFRTLLKHPVLGDRIRPLGSGLLAKGTLPARDRELVILRTCARTGCEYEWGVHVRLFGPSLDADGAWFDATWAGRADDPAFTSRDGVLVRFADAMHDNAQAPDALWAEMAGTWNEEQLIGDFGVGIRRVTLMLSRSSIGPSTGATSVFQ
jgi:4-carboxymuconolactone decarboxylase